MFWGGGGDMIGGLGSLREKRHCSTHQPRGRGEEKLWRIEAFPSIWLASSFSACIDPKQRPPGEWLGFGVAFDEFQAGLSPSPDFATKEAAQVPKSPTKAA